MGKLLTLLFSLAIAAGLAHYVITGSGKNRAGETPPQQLEKVRESAKRIEDDAQKRADDVAARFRDSD